MTVVDTNVLIRIITNDDKSQAARAAVFLGKQDCVFLAKTVLLEAEWVLRSAYGFDSREILIALRGLLDTGNVEVEDEAAVTLALGWYGKGLDLADSLHLASAGMERKFVTFDTGFLRKARRLRAGDVATP